MLSFQNTWFEEKPFAENKNAKLRTLLFDSRNQLSRHALKARTRAFIRGLIASIIPKWLDKILQIEVQSCKKGRLNVHLLR